MLNHQQVQEIINGYGRKIGLSANEVVLRNKPSGFGEPHLEISDDYYHYVICERGSELSRESFLDVEDFIYEFFEMVTSMVAGEYEQENRVIGEDQRVIRFNKQIELMTQLNHEWGRKKEANIAETLKNSPYSINNRTYDKRTWLNKLANFFKYLN
ncbi:Imm63 family immunity protein [Psychrobacter sp. AOP22-C1-C5]